MNPGAMEKCGKAVRQVTDRTFRAAQAVYCWVVRRRSNIADRDAGIEAMLTTIDIHLGDAALAGSKIFCCSRSQFQFWRVIAISAVARTGRDFACLERSPCLCWG
jgi:hypothetical protein